MSYNDEHAQMLKTAERFRDSAYPVTLELQYESDPARAYRSTSKGMSKREFFALHAPMHELVGMYYDRECADLKQCAELAVQYADALIEQLNK